MIGDQPDNNVNPEIGSLEQKPVVTPPPPSVSKVPFSSNFFIIIIFIGVIAVVAFLLISVTSSVTKGVQNAVPNVTNFFVGLGDPANVPSGTTALFLTYSEIELSVIQNGSVKTLHLAGNGTANVLKLQNSSLVIAAVALANGSHVNFIGMNVSKAVITINGVNSSVVVGESILTSNLSGNNTVIGRYTALFDLLPSITEIQTVDNNVFVLTSSVKAVLAPSNQFTSVSAAKNASTSPPPVGAKITFNSTGTVSHLINSLSQNVTITSASLLVNKNITTLSVTVKNNQNSSVMLNSLQILGPKSVFFPKQNLSINVAQLPGHRLFAPPNSVLLFPNGTYINFPAPQSTIPPSLLLYLSQNASAISENSTGVLYVIPAGSTLVHLGNTSFSLFSEAHPFAESNVTKTFEETGLPYGTPWEVYVNGTPPINLTLFKNFTIGSSATFYVPSVCPTQNSTSYRFVGLITYAEPGQAFPGPYFSSGVINHVITQSSSSSSISGFATTFTGPTSFRCLSNQSLELTLTNTTTAVQIDNISITSVDYGQTANATSSSFSVPNSVAYSFNVYPVSRITPFNVSVYSPHPAEGALNQTQNLEHILFNLSSLNATKKFKETGLPSGASFKVRVAAPALNFNLTITTTASEENFSIPIVNSTSYSLYSFRIFNVTFNSVTYLPSRSLGYLNSSQQPVKIAFVPATSPAPNVTKTFLESGLPSGAVWSVKLGTVEATKSAGYNISFSVPNNANYSFLVYNTTSVSYVGNSEYNTSIYHPYPSNGILNKSTNQVLVSFELTHSTISINLTKIFEETGLPPGSTWSVVLDGIKGYGSAGSNLSFSIANLTSYSFLVYNTTYNSVVYRARPSSGTFGSTQQIVHIIFNATTAAIKNTNVTKTFEEIGLPAGSTWAVYLSGLKTGYGNAGSNISFSVPNDTSFSFGIYNTTYTSIVFYPHPRTGSTPITESVIKIIFNTSAATSAPIKTSAYLPNGTEIYIRWPPGFVLPPSGPSPTVINNTEHEPISRFILQNGTLGFPNVNLVVQPGSTPNLGTNSSAAVVSPSTTTEVTNLTSLVPNGFLLGAGKSFTFTFSGELALGPISVVEGASGSTTIIEPPIASLSTSQIYSIIISSSKGLLPAYNLTAT